MFTCKSFVQILLFIGLIAQSEAKSEDKAEPVRQLTAKEKQQLYDAQKQHFEAIELGNSNNIWNGGLGGTEGFPRMIGYPANNHSSQIFRGLKCPDKHTVEYVVRRKQNGYWQGYVCIDLSGKRHPNYYWRIHQGNITASKKGIKLTKYTYINNGRTLYSTSHRYGKKHCRYRHKDGKRILIKGDKEFCKKPELEKIKLAKKIKTKFCYDKNANQVPCQINKESAPGFKVEGGCPGATMSYDQKQISCADGKVYTLEDSAYIQFRHYMKKRIEDWGEQEAPDGDSGTLGQ